MLTLTGTTVLQVPSSWRLLVHGSAVRPACSPPLARRLVAAVHQYVNTERNARPHDKIEKQKKSKTRFSPPGVFITRALCVRSCSSCPVSRRPLVHPPGGCVRFTVFTRRAPHNSRTAIASDGPRDRLQRTTALLFFARSLLRRA